METTAAENKGVSRSGWNASWLKSGSCNDEMLAFEIHLKENEEINAY